MVKKYKNVAIIPARGGSKRLPKKNIIDFFGKPLIAYTIEAALKTDKFARVMVSTDSPEIAEIAEKYGASVPFLRKEHADDFANVSDVTVHTLRRLKAETGEEYDTVCMLMPNCPIRNAKDIYRLCTEFEEKDLNFQISAFKYGWMNPWWAHKLENEGKATPFFADGLTTRSQDLAELYCPTGAVWLAKTDALSESKTFYGEGYHFGILNWKSAVDIDDAEDLEMAKAVYLLEKNSDE